MIARTKPTARQIASAAAFLDPRSPDAIDPPVAKPKRKHPEQALQRQVVQYLTWALPAEVWWTAIPAGGGGELRGKILKGQGYKAGTPDLLIVYRGQARFVEFKSARGKLSDAQRRTHADILLAGSAMAVCRTLDAVRAALFLWGIPTREAKPVAAAIHRGIAESAA